MSLWQFQAVLAGVHRANNPEEQMEAPAPEDFFAALESTVIH